jgi:glycosyltransferase involved in cell wall biosynthesis
MKVSIIIPVYNGEKYIDRCLNSILNQTYKNIELIIIDDGSTDNSFKLLSEYLKKDTRIKVIHKENGGQASARNLGLTKSTGDYIMFVDCDDYIELNMIEELLNLSLKNKSDITVCDLNANYGNKTNNIIKGMINASNNANINFMLSDPGPCAKLFKASILKNNNFCFLENKIYEDLAVIPALAIYTNSISYLEKPFYNYIIHENSTMNQICFNMKLNNIFDSLDNLSNLFNGKYSDELEYIYIKHLLHDASLRFLKFKDKEANKSLKKINKIIKGKYPNWKRNKYLFLLSKKELLLTKIIYNKWFFLYSLYKVVK